VPINAEGNVTISSIQKALKDAGIAPGEFIFLLKAMDVNRNGVVSAFEVTKFIN